MAWEAPKLRRTALLPKNIQEALPGCLTSFPAKSRLAHPFLHSKKTTMIQIALLIWALLSGNPNANNGNGNASGGTTVTTFDTGGEAGHVPPTPPPPPPGNNG